MVWVGSWLIGDGRVWRVGVMEEKRRGRGRDSAMCGVRRKKVTKGKTDAVQWREDKGRDECAERAWERGKGGKVRIEVRRKR